MAIAVTTEHQDPAQSHYDVKLFNSWTFEDVQVGDISLSDYIGVEASKHATYMPHTTRRYSVKRFKKAQCPIVERLTNSLMMHGRNIEKKLITVKIVKHAMEIIFLLTDQNPIQVIVDAIINSGPREDCTRIGFVGVVRRQVVNISLLHRINQAIYLLTIGARESPSTALPAHISATPCTDHYTALSHLNQDHFLPPFHHYFSPDHPRLAPSELGP